MDLSPDEPHLRVDVNGGYVEGNCDSESCELLKQSLGLLAQTVGIARQKIDRSTSIHAAKTIIALCTLAIGEAQALLLLVSAQLDRPSRIHLRSLYEYKIRAEIVNESKEKAEAFMLAAASEARIFSEVIGLDQAKIDESIAFYIPADLADRKPGREKSALGGDMKTIITNRADKREYGAFFSWPSQISHGSILALHEVAKAIRGALNDFPAKAAQDGHGDQYILGGATLVHSLTLVLILHFRIGGGLDALLTSFAERVSKRKTELSEASSRF